jgi:hypothetical protein
MKEQQELIFKLTEQDVSIIKAGLGNLPVSKAFDTVLKFINQYNEQVNPSKKDETK